MIAESNRRVGNSRQVWREQLVSLSLIDQVRDLPRRHTILSSCARICQDTGLVRTALWIEGAALEAASREPEPTLVVDVLTWRSLTRHELGFDDGAAQDLDDARRWIGRVRDSAIAATMNAVVDAVEGQILARRHPEQATNSLERAITYFESSAPALIPSLRLDLSRAQLGRGLDAAAEAELTSAIEMVESQRASQKGGKFPAQFFDTTAPLFDEMVDLQLDKRHDPQRALAFVERGRARQLLDSIQSSRRAR